MEAEVLEARGPTRTKSKPPLRRGNVSADAIDDDVETWTTRVPNSVLDECQKAFIAAQEGVTKASKDFYVDTGVMALLCRHDWPLWIVNLTTPGERQYYALSLLKHLFTHLPPKWTVGSLYDNNCQVHHSIITAVCIIQGMRLFILKKKKCLVNSISLSILHRMI